LVDNGDAARGGVVFVGEVAACDQRMPQGAQIARADAIPWHGFGSIRAGHAFAGLHNGLPPVSVEWADEGDAGAAYAREAAEFLFQLAIENVQVINAVRGER